MALGAGKVTVRRRTVGEDGDMYCAYGLEVEGLASVPTLVGGRTHLWHRVGLHRKVGTAPAASALEWSDADVCLHARGRLSVGVRRAAGIGDEPSKNVLATVTAPE